MQAIKGANILLVICKDKSKFIMSGMFPFSSKKDQRICELIDYIMPESAEIVKKINYLYSMLAKVLSGIDVVNSALSVLSILKEQSNTDDLEEIVKKDLEEIVTHGYKFLKKSKQNTFNNYFSVIGSKLLEYYKAYSSALVEYFEELKNITEKLSASEAMIAAEAAVNQMKDLQGELIDLSGQVITAKILKAAEQQFRNQKIFKENAYKLVHTENILLYLLTKKQIEIADDGVRFYTRFDMCKRCEDLVWRYANTLSKNEFIVLSSIEFKDEKNQQVENSEEGEVLKKYRLLLHSE